MLLGYNTNGFAHHRTADALAILSEIGYGSVALTLGSALLDPPDRKGVSECVRRIMPLLQKTGMRVTVETGARFLLDPRRKHQPTLVSRSPGDRARRIEFLKAAIDVAASIRADSVSLWSGTPDDRAEDSELFHRLVNGLGDVLQYAESRAVRLSFEPEPGMFIATMARFDELFRRVAHPLFGLTLDVGHVHCLGDDDIGGHIRRWRDVLWNLHIEDMRHGVHEHLPFGEGEIDFTPVFAALHEIGFRGPLHVELSRHSHDAVNLARRSHEFLRRFIGADASVQ